MGRGAVVMPGAGVRPADWERIFGSEETRLETFRAAVAAQRIAERSPVAADSGPAVHDDREFGHKGVFNDALGVTLTSRTQMREYCKRHKMIEVTGPKVSR